MKKEKVIAALKFYKDVDKSIRLNERVVKNLEIQYYNSSRPVTSSGMPHGKGGTSNPVESAVLNIPKSVPETNDSSKCEVLVNAARISAL